jgi:hypothetical protein
LRFRLIRRGGFALPSFLNYADPDHLISDESSLVAAPPRQGNFVIFGLDE